MGPLPYNCRKPGILRIGKIQRPVEKESLKGLDAGLTYNLGVISIDRNRRVPRKCLIHRRGVEQSPKPIPKAQYCLTTADIRDPLNRQTFGQEATKALIRRAWRVDGLSIRANDLWQPAMLMQIPAEAEWPQCSHSPVRREVVGYDKDFFRAPTHDSNQARLGWAQGINPMPLKLSCILNPTPHMFEEVSFFPHRLVRPSSRIPRSATIVRVIPCDRVIAAHSTAVI